MLYIGGASTLRRTLAGLLLAEHGYRTKRTDRVVLVARDEARGTYLGPQDWTKWIVT